MGGNYEKDMYKQLCELMSRVDSLETDHKKDRKEIKRLNKELEKADRRIAYLSKTVDKQAEELVTVKNENRILKKENSILRSDNERMRRILNNNSDNSSLPPSTDKNKPGKAANEYNSRNTTSRKQGAQKGHKGTTLTKRNVESMIRDGILEHKVLKEFGIPGPEYTSRYVLDFSIKTIADEIRIYPDEHGKYHIPDEYRSDVTYGAGIRAIVSMLYSDGVVSNDRIAEFVNGLSGDVLRMSTGTVYHICQQFGSICKEQRPFIEEDLLNSDVLCTDATNMCLDGKQKYIRNFSNLKSVLYAYQEKKKLKVLSTLPILPDFVGILIHDHETALYHFGTEHGECCVHLIRYLRKNTEESQNTWSKDLMNFLAGMNAARKNLIEQGSSSFDEDALKKYFARYDELVELGYRQNEKTSNRLAKKEEKTLLNRLVKYKANHLLFLKDFRVPFDDNMSERDLRMCKQRQKMSGGFRTDDGIQMFCDIMSVIRTIKRRGMNIFQSINDLFAGRPVLA